MESRRIGKRSGSARDGDAAFFQRLAHHFDRATRELRQLVEKEYAMMRETDLTGFYGGAAADERDLANRVMGISKRARADDARSTPE